MLRRSPAWLAFGRSCTCRSSGPFGPRCSAPSRYPSSRARADVTGDFPVVVVVDSGISDGIPALESWVVGRDSQVAPKYQNTDHGTFVAGLICWGSELNPTIAGLDASSLRRLRSAGHPER